MTDEYSPDSEKYQAHVRRINRLNELRRELGLRVCDRDPWDPDLDCEPFHPHHAEPMGKARALRARMRRSKQGRAILAEASQIEDEYFAEMRRDQVEYERKLAAGEVPSGWKPAA